MNNEFKDVKVGDKVFVTLRYSTELYTVTRLTKTQIVAVADNNTGFEYKFNRDSGKVVGAGSFSWTSLHSIATPDAITSFNKKREIATKVSKLRDFNFGQLPAERVEAVFEIVKPYLAEGENKS